MHIKPSFLILGVQKGGTTSLAQYLVHHPAVAEFSFKEINYFDQDVNYSKGLNWYHSFFPLKTDDNADKLVFDATPEYIYYPHCAIRISKYNCKMKFIVTLRDPVERAYSAWNMFTYFRNYEVYSHLVEYRDFKDAITDELYVMKNMKMADRPMEPGYLSRGFYVDQLERYFKLFPREQFYITEIGMLKHHAEDVLTEISDFLELPPKSWSEVRLTPSNIGIYKVDNMATDVREMLSDLYRSYNKRLFNLIGKEFDWT